MSVWNTFPLPKSSEQPPRFDNILASSMCIDSRTIKHIHHATTLLCLCAICQMTITFDHQLSAGADPGFLERWFICIKVWGDFMLILSHFS